MTLSIAGINKAMREVGLADESQYFLKIANVPDDNCLVESVRLDGWTFHRDFSISVKVLLRHELPDDDVIGLNATLSVIDRGVLSPLHAIVTEVRDADGNGDYAGLELTLGSALWPLHQRRHNRVFVDRSANDIARDVLEQALDGHGSVEVLAKTTPVLPMTVQYEETDYQFVRRILAREGVYLHLHQADGDTIVQLVGDLSQLTEGETPIPLRYATNAGAAKNDEHIFKVTRVRNAATRQFQLADTNPWLSTDLTSQHDVDLASADGVQHHWGLNTQDTDRSQALGDRLAEHALWQASTRVFETTCRSLKPGSLIELTDHPELSGSFRVVEVLFSGSQRGAAGNGLGGQENAFQCRVTVIPADLAYRPPYQPRPPVYGTFTATIDTEVDERGLYRLRYPFDARTESDGPASPPTRLMQTLGGEDHGMHFPLAKGTEVAVTCENGDLDRPIVLGALYNRQAHNPVTDGNARHNLIQTRAGQRFLMDDTPEQEAIHLETPEAKNRLSLSAEQDAHLATLESVEGDVRLHAGEAMTLESGKNQTTTVGADHTVHVKGNQQLQTEEGKITVESATDIEYSAGEAIRWQTREGEMTLSSGAAMQWQVGDGLTQQIDSGDCEVRVNDGSFLLEAAADILFNGIDSGTLTLAQGDGLIQIDSGGNLTLDAPQVDITADTIAIKGGTIGNN
ncbi:type VI secretion system Vgr family protein [Saccharospirillum salsuginis]|uniref:Gp5/Type VI secretion system Vgr protein OB-fold domain-containing protein n=1 Tax=Saccharospirillum salsuginis TaxID=418750 RepID=A0A918KEQ6_9GAMM|nr:type VI secretion system Vgr family protein [Saccharospirillum salsuginis]GGX59508.1 hypothetical protein GCM10007392_29310 [Saccharospirillum salsuginis]